MKTRSTIFTKVLTVALLLWSVNAGVAMSQETKSHGDGDHAAKTGRLVIPKSLPALWGSIIDHNKELHEVLAAKKLDDVHHHAFAVRDLVAALPVKSAALSADKKTSLGKSVSRVASLAKLLDEAGDAGDLAKVTSLSVKMDAEIKTIEALYPAKDLKQSQGSADAAKQVYACSMHPEVTSDKPGDCPKCGMALVAQASVGSSSHEVHSGMSGHASGHGASTITASASPVSEWAMGKSVNAVVKLVNSQSGSPLTPDDLKVAHTKKVHLLIIDESLTDYQHEHPEYSGTPGVWKFSFTPRKPGPYRIWADLLPTATGEQEYAITGILGSGTPEPVRDMVMKLVDTVEGKVYELKLDSPKMSVGKATMATLNVRVLGTGAPFTQLEPLMEAYAHLVGFSTDMKSILHIHPLGTEPKSDSDRGGPTLEFHIQPTQAGYIRLFAQVQIGGVSKYADFGVIVSQQ